MNFKAVIFDLDGTLLDTLDDIADSMNSILTRHGFPVHERDRYRHFVGDGVEMLVKRALPVNGQAEGILRECLREYNEEYEKKGNQMTGPYDGVIETLNRLKSLPIRLAVLSNKPHDATLRCVNEFFPANTFDMALGQMDGMPRKPDPAGALRIAEFLDLSPQDILYCGDTDVDMKTAVAAGMYPVGVLWGFRSMEELKTNGARALIRHPGEIIELIDK